MRMIRSFIILFVLLLLAAEVLAQAWSGQGRVNGRVVDTDGAPVADAQVTLHLAGQPAAGPPPLSTDARGRWAYLGVTSGPWTVTVSKEGYVEVSGDFRLTEHGRNPQIEVELAPIPEEVIRAREMQAAVDRVQEANRLLAEGQHAASRELYEQALPHLEPEHQAAVLRAIARTYFQEGDATAAEAALKRALELHPEDVEALQLLATFLVADGREEEAEEYIARLPEGADMDPVTLLNMGIRSFNQGDVEQAHAFFARAVQAAPEMPETHYYFGLTCMVRGMTDEARTAFETVLELDPDGEHAADVREFLEAL